MCGLAGELRFTPIDQAPRPADLAAVERITHHLAPRGPDAWGFHSQGPIALGHRRLKIMDLSDGSAQPMVDSQLGLSLAFNGAIYNFPELRQELQDLGYSPLFLSGEQLEAGLPPSLARSPTIYVGEPRSLPFEQARLAGGCILEQREALVEPGANLPSNPVRQQPLGP